MTFKRSKNMGIGALLLLLLFVGSIPTLIIYNMSDTNDELSVEIKGLENLFLVNSLFWSAAVNFNKQIRHTDREFGEIANKLGEINGLIETFDNQLKLITFSHASEYNDLTRLLKTEIQRFRVAVILYQKEFEADPAADQTDQLEQLAYSSFEKTNDILLKLTNKITAEVGHHHIDIVQQIEKSQFLSLIGLIAGIFIAFFVAVKLSRVLDRPLQKLLTGVQAIEKGQLGKQIDVETQDEFGRLATAFNSMSSALKRSNEKQKALSERLMLAAESEKSKSEKLALLVDKTKAASEAKSKILGQKLADKPLHLVTHHSLSEEGQLFHLHILIADDNQTNQKLTLAMLKKFGCRVSLANNGKEAVEMFKEYLPDLVLMDCQMPVMDGYQATEAIRRHERKIDRHTPIVALTAHVMKGDKEKCLVAGMDDYMGKPFKMDELKQTLEKCLFHGRESRDKTNTDAGGEPSGDSAGNLENGTHDGSMDSACVIDSHALQVIKDLQMEGEPNLLLSVIEKYLSGSESKLAELRNNSSSPSVKDLQAGAHFLKSSSANVGAMNFFELCKEIEMECRDGTVDDVSGYVTKMESEFARVKSELEKEVRQMT